MTSFNLDNFPTKYLTFDDVGLVPRFNTIKSRLNTDISVSLDGIKYNYPFVPANMNTVIGTKMADIITELNGMIIYHRFCPIEEKLEILKKYKNVYMSCGISDEEKKDIDILLENGCSKFCIDVAHGHCSQVGDLIEYIKNKISSSSYSLVAGNVCSAEGYEYLARKGATIIKVGIGGGSICTTRLKTGFGVPQLTAVMLCNKMKQKLEQENIKTWLISDGGINHPKDAVIAIANGADMIMMGSKFARTLESAGKKYVLSQEKYIEYDLNIHKSEQIYNHYQGQASFIFMQNYYKKSRVAEGEDFYLKCTMSCNDVIDEYCGSLKSALTYNGSSNINEFMYNVIMFEASNNYMNESGTRKN